MTAEEIKAILEGAPNVGKVKHIDFEHYCRVMERKNRQTGEKMETLYMDVDGKMAMCITDHALQDATWEQFPPVVMEQSEKRLTLMMKIVSTIHGTRFGIASSRSNGPAAEGSHPWESAETSALGRAMVNMGYGLLPGAGRASGEDMQNATPPAAKKAKPRAKKKAPPKRAPEATTTPENGPEGAPAEALNNGGKVTQFYRVLSQELKLDQEAVMALLGFEKPSDCVAWGREQKAVTLGEVLRAVREAQAQVNGKDERG